MGRVRSAQSDSRITMADVAQAAGVSKITVSRALNGSKLVRADLRERVTEVAATMGYRINLAARDLRLNQRRRIAVVVDMQARDDRPLYDPYPLALLGGLLQESAAAGYAVVLTTSDPRVSVEAHDASGVILLGQGPGHRAVRDLLRLGLPLVVWGADDGVEDRLGAIVVGSDNLMGGSLAADHLIARNRARMVFLGDTSHAEMADRESGFRARLLERDKQYLGTEVCDFTVKGGREAFAAVLAADPSVDGVFAASDLVAIGAMQAMREANRQPGRDIGVVGYDDAPAAVAHSPRLTSIRQDWTAGGQLLAASLLAELDPTSFAPPHSHVLPVGIAVRDT